MDINKPKLQQKQIPTASFIPLGGLENVTRNMYVYEYGNEILIVDCGLGFPDETMIGIDLLLPDISYLEKTNKKIVGMLLTHGHEDHIGGTPYILPQLLDREDKKFNFPIYATPFTAALTNEKLKEFKLPYQVKAVRFESPEVRLGNFQATFIRITHSVPDTSNIFIKTPAGNFYHGSDFKFDLTPADGRRTDFQRIAKTATEGVTCLMSDCLGSERPGFTASESPIERNFEDALLSCTGKFIVTTYSSNVARLNQVIKAAEKMNRKVCFIGRSLVKVKNVAQKMGYLQMKNHTEVSPENLGKYKDKQLVLLVAGSQGQENSAMTRIAEGIHSDISLRPNDVVVLSSDPIPGNELPVTGLIDAIAKSGAKVLYSGKGDHFHVSGHGARQDLELMISLTKPKNLLPISGKYKHMALYKDLAKDMGYQDNAIFLIDNGQEIIFSKNGVKRGRKFQIRNVFVDQVSGEEVESFVLRDREKLAKEGIVIIMAEISNDTGQLVQDPDIIAKGFTPKDAEEITKILVREIGTALSARKGRVSSWVHIRKMIEDTAGKHIFRGLRRRPLVLPVIVEV
jgi:ribonuclease J